MATSTRRIGTWLMWLGSAAFLLGVLAAYTGSWIPRYVEFPLGYMGSFAVDSDGRIYCGTQSYSRVQIYDSGGRFVASYYVDVGGGRFELDIDEADRLVVVGGRTQDRSLYDHDMVLLSRTPDPGGRIFKNLKQRGVIRYTDRHGVSYFSRDFFLLYPHIVAIGQSGESHVVVRTPIYLWPLMSPLPSWLFIGVGWWIRATRD
jgi:hypothetical protein